jgi:hypothetical protein
MALLTACERPLVPLVPESLRQPVQVPDSPVTTTGQLARRAVDLTAAVQNANARIVAIDCILDAAEAGDPDPACTGPR